MTTITTATRRCPECARTMEVEDRGADGVRVLLHGATPAAPCCERTMTENYSRTGMFITNPSG